jgi:Uma2 family endonuclease
MAGVTVAHPRVSFADLEQWPEDGRRYELYDGEIYVVPSPLPLHQVVAARLYDILRDYAQAHGGIVLFAPLDIVLTDYDVVQPDLLLFTRQRQNLIKLRKVTRYAPDLAIEIVSPGTASNDRGRKKNLFARHGVQEYWLVDPDAIRIEVYALSGDQFLIASAATGAEAVRSPLLPALHLRPIDVVPNSTEDE